MDPPRTNIQQPRVSRATSLRLERQKSHGPASSGQASLAHTAEASEAVPTAREPSPTKLPVGSSRRPASSRQASGAPIHPDVPSHKRHGSTPSIRSQASDVSTSRTAQAATLPPVKETLPMRDGHGKSKPSIARKVTPTARPPSGHARPVSRDSADPRGARKGKHGGPLTDSKGLEPPARNPSSHARNASHGSSQIKSKDQAVTAGTPSSAKRSEAAHSRGLVDSSLELLQLHAIHARSGKTQREWVESARKSYESQFKDVVAFKDAVQAREMDLIMQRNASAVIEWGSQAGGDTLERRLQVLSSTLDEAWQLSNSTGRYPSVVQAFEQWYDNAAKVLSDSSERNKLSQPSMNIAEGLGDGWKAEVSSLQESLLLAANNILSLGDIEGESDIVRSITLALELIKNMLEELELMESIEENMVHQQREWVTTSLNELRRKI